MTNKATDEFGSTVEIGDEIMVKSDWFTVDSIDEMGDNLIILHCTQQDTGEWAEIDFDDVDHINHHA